jgi:hypothetical protein
MTETLFFLFSAHSQACKQLFPIIQNLSKHLTIHPVDIDHIDIRQKVTLTDIKTVPCIVVQTNEKIMVLENTELADFIQRIVGMVQASQQPPPQPPQLQTTSLVSPEDSAPASLNMSYTSSVNSRLQPVEFSSPPPQEASLTSSTPAPAQNFMMIEDIPSSPQQTGGGYSKQDILGGSASESPKDYKMASVKSASEQMMREREEAESASRKGP